METNSKCSISKFEGSITCNDVYRKFKGRFLLNECNYNTKKHLIYHGLILKNQSRGKQILSEANLIKMRLGIENEKQESNLLDICAAHRCKLGIEWIPSKNCVHKSHFQISKKFQVQRKIGLDLATKILKVGSMYLNKSPLFYPIGSKMCIDCYKKLNNEVNEHLNPLKIDSPVNQRIAKISAKEKLNIIQSEEMNYEGLGPVNV